MCSEMTNSEKNSLLFLSLAAGAVMNILFNLLVHLHYYSLPEVKQGVAGEMVGDDWEKALLMFAAMLGGMFFNQLFELLKARKSAGLITINVGKLFFDGLRGISFWMAVVVSPVIFYGTYYLVDTLPGSNVAFFYAFQNGFFWFNVFNKFETNNKFIRYY